MGLLRTPLHIQHRPTAFGFVILVGLTLAAAFGHGIGSIPHGVYCDEALIGITAGDWLRGERPLTLFFDHYGTVSGSLPWIAVAPFVGIFGLSAFSIRLSSVVICLVASLCVYGCLRLTGARYATLAWATLLCAPVFIHISRITFGHAPGFLFLVLGSFIYLLSIHRGDGSELDLQV